MGHIKVQSHKSVLSHICSIRDILRYHLSMFASAVIHITYNLNTSFINLQPCSITICYIFIFGYVIWWHGFLKVIIFMWNRFNCDHNLPQWAGLIMQWLNSLINLLLFLFIIRKFEVGWLNIDNNSPFRELTCQTQTACLHSVFCIYIFNIIRKCIALNSKLSVNN